MSAPDHYVLGHEPQEIERLKLQGSVIGGVTRRLIRESGIGAGMRVLDIGCGSGDVSLLLAEAVGPSGRVVGFDREERTVATARQRLAAAGIANAEIIHAADDTMPAGEAFDAAIGRYVLVHQANPVAMLQRAAEAVRPGGIVAFHELVISPPNNFQAWPRLQLFDAVAKAVRDTMLATLQSPEFATAMVQSFAAAGLGQPKVFWESIVGGADSPLVRWMAQSYRVLHPHAVRLGLYDEIIGDVDSLEVRMLDAAAMVNAQVSSRPQACGWAIRP
jgi:ubiquinone/menaquinone biosynthesis C-methylase UbiE